MRIVSNSNSLPLIGSIGVLLVAKEEGVIRELKPLLDKQMKKRIRIFFISDYRNVTCEPGRDPSY